MSILHTLRVMCSFFWWSKGAQKATGARNETCLIHFPRLICPTICQPMKMQHNHVTQKEILFFSENGKNDKEHWTFYVVKNHLKLISIIDIGFISSRRTSVCFILVLRPSLCTSKSENDQTWKATTPLKNCKKENMTTLCWKLFRTAGKKCKWAI